MTEAKQIHWRCETCGAYGSVTGGFLAAAGVGVDGAHAVGVMVTTHLDKYPTHVVASWPRGHRDRMTISVREGE